MPSEQSASGTERETSVEEVEIVECPDCGKQAGIAEPRSGGVRAVCNDCETDMLSLSFFDDSSDTGADSDE